MPSASFFPNIEPSLSAQPKPQHPKHPKYYESLSPPPPPLFTRRPAVGRYHHTVARSPSPCRSADKSSRRRAEAIHQPPSARLTFNPSTSWWLAGGRRATSRWTSWLRLGSRKGKKERGWRSGDGRRRRATCVRHSMLAWKTHKRTLMKRQPAQTVYHYIYRNNLLFLIFRFYMSIWFYMSISCKTRCNRS